MNKILLDRDITLLIFLVSIYNQIIESKETSGIDAIIPPRNVFFFDISETITIITEEVNSLIKKCNIKNFIL